MSHPDNIELKTAAKAPQSLTHIAIEGMTCGACVSAVTNGLQSLEGVSEVAVSLVTERAAVRHETSVSVDELLERVEDTGFGATLVDSEPQASVKKIVVELDGNPGTQTISSIETTKLKIFGMTCATCSGSVEEGLRQVDGVRDAVVSLVTEEARVEYDTGKVGIRSLINAVEERGFDAVLAKSADNSQQLAALSRIHEIQKYRKDAIWAAILGLPVFVMEKCVPGMLPFLGFLKTRLISSIYLDDLICMALTIPVQFGIGWRFYQKSYITLKHGAPNMDVLVAVSTSCAFFFSLFSVLYNVIKGMESPPTTLWDTSVMIITFVVFGKYLENRAKGQTSVALSRLISLMPSTTTIYADPEKYHPAETAGLREQTVSTDLLQVNDIVILRPGEKVPADGIVLDGTSFVSEALITGESYPLSKNPGDSVIGGSVNGSGRLEFRVLRAGSDTKLSHIVRLVEDAQTTRAPVQQFVDYVAGYFVPCVLLLGISTFAIWMVLSHVIPNPPPIFNSSEGSLMICLRLCISVIVVACPCALGLATPTAVMVATGVGAQNGILIKGGAVLEAANKVNVVLFDKTGTLTYGDMKISDHKILFKEPNLWWHLVGLLEESSEHPIARSLVAEAKAKCSVPDGVQFEGHISAFENTAGRGVQGVGQLADGASHHVMIGNKTMLAENGVEFTESIDSVTEGEQTYVLVAIDHKFAGWMTMSDSIKPNAKQTLDFLKARKFEVGMVSGDQRAVGLRVAQSIGISSSLTWTGVAPEGKIEIVRQLQEQGRIVAFVGDGVNDSPALAASDLGIALSGGSDVAMEAADIVLLKDSLQDVAAAFDLSKKAFRRIKLNLLWAVIYNLIMIPFAMGIFLPFGWMLNPMLASAAMAMSSISVLISSLLLQLWRSPLSDESSQKGFESMWTRLVSYFTPTSSHVYQSVPSVSEE
jgi:P-type Cu+ transporter